LALVFQIPDFLTACCFITTEASCAQNTWKAPHPALKKKKSALQCYCLVGVYNLSNPKIKSKNLFVKILRPKCSTGSPYGLPHILADQYQKFKETHKRYFFCSGCHISDK